MTLLHAYRRNERGGITAILVDRDVFPPGHYDSPDKVPHAGAKPLPIVAAPTPAEPLHPGEETRFASPAEGMATVKRGPGRPRKHPRG